ncbi:unnamed protein product [Ceutorhynchus assimilis]|uniref:Antistasin-like domain-containing protein n=1 Tax=Ceutorhynchus assimilis TaxID=467358 RepID=A0A9N9QMJ4_9CUCU|nr:unnamed protein product [Ceutorhynchus assimilis]
MYKHNETWLKDRGCTFCTCLNGEPKCISHYCDFKERKIDENISIPIPCLFDGKSYAHGENVSLVEQCKLCTCDNGTMSCLDQSCPDKEVSILGECQPLFDCNKRCSNGFRINKKGCEICKCNPSNSNSLLSKYNITYSELLDLLNDYKRNKSEPITTSTSTSTPIPTLIIVRSFGNREEEKTEKSNDSNKRNEEDDKSCWIIISALAVLIVGIVAGIAGYCTYRNRRQYSITPSRGSYHSVTADNNNTIKKRFDE